MGSASSPSDSLEWKGACFYENTAWMEFHNKTGSEFGGGTLHIKVSNATQYLFFLSFSVVFVQIRSFEHLGLLGFFGWLSVTICSLESN